MIRSIPEGSQPFGARQPSLALQGFLAGSSAIPPGSIESFRRPFRGDRCAQPPANGCDPSGIIGAEGNEWFVDKGSWERNL